MKKIILLYILVNVSFFVYAQDTVYVQGYYIQRFLKKEILFKTQNQVLREKGKPFEIMIDLKAQSFFFSLQVNLNISLWTKEFIGNILQSNQDYKNIEIFYFPPFNEYHKSYFNKFDIPIQNVEFSSQCGYYVNGDDTVYVYKLYYIEGYALKIQVDNDYLDKQRDINLAVKWNLDPTIINRGIPSFYAYLFYKIDTVNCDLPPKGFVKWNSKKNIVLESFQTCTRSKQKPPLGVGSARAEIKASVHACHKTKFCK